MIIFKMSLSAIALILLIIIVRAVFYDVMPKAAFSVMWGIAVVKLLIPIKFPITIKTNEVVTEKLFYEKTTFVQNLLMSPEIRRSVYQSVRYIDAIWLVVATTIALYFICVHCHWRKIYETALPLDNKDIQIWKEKHILSREITILQLDRGITPLTYGVIRPRIIIPKYMLKYGKEKVEYVLSHEYMHIKHFDVLGKSLLVICLCAHWFNPFVWMLYILANRDIERLCDACVIKEYGTTQKSGYALTLIDFFSMATEASPFSNGFCKKSTEERITSIMRTRKTTKRGIITSILFVAIVALFSFSTVSANENKDVKNTDLNARVMGLETDDSIPTITLREDAIKGSYSAVVNDENGNIIYKEENIMGESDEVMKHIYGIILNSESEERK